MVRILFVEDQEKEMETLKKLFLDVERAALFFVSSAEAALELAEREPMDIFFLDVELPGMSGFELAGKLRSMDRYGLAQIVFVTGYAKNPLEAYKNYHCYDFIEKPFSHEALKEKAKQLIDRVERHGETIKKSERKPIFHEGEVFMIPMEEVLYIEVQGRLCKLYLAGKTVEIKDISLKWILQELEQAYLVQCHKSFAVNINKIEYLKKLSYRNLEMTIKGSEAVIPLTISFSENIFEKMKRMRDVKGA